MREDYFGELGLFQSKTHAYSARAMTHLDTFKLLRSDFEAVMREHPGSALKIADMLPLILPQNMAANCVRAIHELVGADASEGHKSRIPDADCPSVADAYDAERPASQGHAGEGSERELRVSASVAPTSEQVQSVSPSDLEGICQVRTPRPRSGRPVGGPPAASVADVEALSNSHSALAMKVDALGEGQKRVEALLEKLLAQQGVTQTNL